MGLWEREREERFYEFARREVKGFLERGFSWEDALRFFFDDYPFPNLEDYILILVYFREKEKPEKFEDGYIFIPNEREVIIDLIVERYEKSRKYIYNLIYELRHNGFLKTKVITRERKRYTLLYLTEEGRGRVEQIFENIKEGLEPQQQVEVK